MGVAGSVDFPTHMKDYHQDLMDNTGVDTLTPSMLSLMENAYTGAGNPYNARVAYDPGTRISKFSKEVEDFQTLIDGYDPTTAWEGYVTSVVAKLDGEVFDDTEII